MQDEYLAHLESLGPYPSLAAQDTLVDDINPKKKSRRFGLGSADDTYGNASSSSSQYNHRSLFTSTSKYTQEDVDRQLQEMVVAYDARLVAHHQLMERQQQEIVVSNLLAHQVSLMLSQHSGSQPPPSDSS